MLVVRDDCVLFNDDALFPQEANCFFKPPVLVEFYRRWLIEIYCIKQNLVKHHLQQWDSTKVKMMNHEQFVQIFLVWLICHGPSEEIRVVHVSRV